MSFPILDSHGRLFGKINLIDLSVLIGILLVGMAGYKLLFEKEKAPPHPPTVQVAEERRSVIVTIEIPNKPLWFSRAITVGDMETNEQNQPIGIILTKKTRPVKSPALGPDGHTLLLNHPSQVDIFLKVELKANVMKGELLFKNVKLKIGKGIFLETKTLSLEGIVIDVQPN